MTGWLWSDGKARTIGHDRAGLVASFTPDDPTGMASKVRYAGQGQARLLNLTEAIPAETTIVNFRPLLEANDLAEDNPKLVDALLARKGLLLRRGSIVDATIIGASSSTRDADGERDPKMRQTQKGGRCCSGCRRTTMWTGTAGASPKKNHAYDRAARERLHRAAERPRSGLLAGVVIAASSVVRQRSVLLRAAGSRRMHEESMAACTPALISKRTRRRIGTWVCSPILRCRVAKTSLRRAANSCVTTSNEASPTPPFRR